jgi:hypothetical protein
MNVKRNEQKVGTHQENPKLLNLYLFFLFMLNSELRRKSKNKKQDLLFLLVALFFSPFFSLNIEFFAF